MVARVVAAQSMTPLMRAASKPTGKSPYPISPAPPNRVSAVQSGDRSGLGQKQRFGRAFWMSAFSQLADILCGQHRLPLCAMSRHCRGASERQSEIASHEGDAYGGQPGIKPERSSLVRYAFVGGGGGGPSGAESLSSSTASPFFTSLVKHPHQPQARLSCRSGPRPVRNAKL